MRAGLRCVSVCGSVCPWGCVCGLAGESCGTTRQEGVCELSLCASGVGARALLTVLAPAAFAYLAHAFVFCLGLIGGSADETPKHAIDTRGPGAVPMTRSELMSVAGVLTAMASERSVTVCIRVWIRVSLGLRVRACW